jgi:AhpD family alkylhydroperoxidase
MQGSMALNAAVRKSGVSATVLALVHMRASQINGCSVCVDMGWRELKHAGETDVRLFTVAAWRETPYFSDAERAALALAEAATRVADRPDPVPDEVWEEAARHFSEQELAGITLMIAMTNFWNRMNLTTRQITGEWVEGVVEQVEKQMRAAAD